MQERPQYKITPDQGWSQMQTLLDKSMPVAYRSRRFLLFWLTTTAAAITLLASLYLWKERAPATDPQPVATTPIEMANNDVNTTKAEVQPITPSSKINNADKVNNEHKMNAVASAQKSNTNSASDKKIHRTSIVKAKSSSSTTNNSISKNNSTNTNSITFAPSPNLLDPEQSEVIIVDHDKDITKEEVAVSEENQSENDFVSGIHDAGSVRINYPSLEFLPLAGLDYEASDENIGLILPGNLFHPVKRHALKPDIFMGAMAGSQKGLGFNGGVGADYALNSRLSLTADVGLGTYRPGALVNHKESSLFYDEIVRTDGNYAETYIVGEKLNSSTDYHAINPFVKSIRQWEISAGMKYAIAKRFFIEGGLTLGLGTTAKSEYPIVTFLGVATPTADTNVETFFNSYDIVRSNMTTIYGALGYHLTRNFSISLNWKQGLNHYLLNGQSGNFQLDPSGTEKRSDYIRGLNLLLTYTL
ncbi:MAG TPA: hypothetical protein VFG10_15495 [Saprospiraceae bacterium]|nr:hypothetical protein [Saprospiraceae bacterium]